MPTNQNAYNSRVTDEALEKRFRDTFRAQGGAELVDDLYASGVIVPVVDFTAAAEGTSLAQNLQTAWDSSTGSSTVFNTTSTLISNAGFWQVDLNLFSAYNNSAASTATVQITDGLSSTIIWRFNSVGGTGSSGQSNIENDKFVVFLQSGDSLTATTNDTFTRLALWYRQIATVSGDLVDPSGFTSS